MDKIRVAICDDAEFICKSIRMDTEETTDLVCVMEAYSAAECKEKIADASPDVLLLDILMETPLAGIEIIPELKKLCPSMKIIMFTGQNDTEYIFSAFVNGADDYVMKDTSNNEILKKCREVYANESSLHPEVAKIITQHARKIADAQKSMMFLVNIMTKLSKSEFEVLKMVYNGDTYKTIAKKRYVEETTIKTLAMRILRKFEVGSMRQLIATIKKSHVMELFKE